MGSVTLAQLKTRARSRANMPVVGFVTDAELLDWVNEGLSIIHGKLVSAYGEKYVESQSVLTTVSGQSDYSLPADFFKLWGIDLPIAGRTRTLRPYTYNERNIYKDARFSNVAPPRYTIVGTAPTAILRLLPTPPSAVGTIFYAPEYTKLALDADAWITINGWEKYVVAYAAQQMLMKEESDIRELTKQIDTWDAELDELAENRDAAFPRSAVDVEALVAWDEHGWP